MAQTELVCFFQSVGVCPLGVPILEDACNASRGDLALGFFAVIHRHNSMYGGSDLIKEYGVAGLTIDN